MNQAQKNEYDFFMRAAALFEQKAVTLAPQKNDIYVADMFRQAADDKRNAELWAQRIEAGVKFTLPEK